MKINSINAYNSSVSFRANGNETKQIAPLSQQQQNSVNFAKEQALVQKADSMSANPITSLGYKLYRTFRIISEHEPSAATTPSLNVVA